MRPSEKLRDYLDIWRGEKDPKLLGIANEVDGVEYRLQVCETELRKLRDQHITVKREVLAGVLAMVREYHRRDISPIHLMGACNALTKQLEEAIAALDKEG